MPRVGMAGGNSRIARVSAIALIAIQGFFFQPLLFIFLELLPPKRSPNGVVRFWWIAKLRKCSGKEKGKSPLYRGFNKRTRIKMQVRRLLTTINPKTRGQGRNRTAVRGFADPYLAARPPDPTRCAHFKALLFQKTKIIKKTLVY